MQKIQKSGGERCTNFKVSQITIDQDRIVVPDRDYLCGNFPTYHFVFLLSQLILYRGPHAHSTNHRGISYPLNTIEGN